MNKLLNRRHLYLPTKNLNGITNLIEQIDEYLSYSKNLEATSSGIFIYMNTSEEFMVGREIMGHDSQIQHHDQLRIQDYGSSPILRAEKVIVKSYEELTFKISSMQAEAVKVVRAETSNLFEFTISLF